MKNLAKALAKTVALLTWITILFAIPVIYPSPPVWAVFLWCWVFALPLVTWGVYDLGRGDD